MGRTQQLDEHVIGAKIDVGALVGSAERRSHSASKNRGCHNGIN